MGFSLRKLLRRWIEEFKENWVMPCNVPQKHTLMVYYGGGGDKTLLALIVHSMVKVGVILGKVVIICLWAAPT